LALAQAEVDRVWGTDPPRYGPRLWWQPVDLYQLLPPGLRRVYEYGVSGTDLHTIPVSNTVLKETVAHLRRLLLNYSGPTVLTKFEDKLRYGGWQVHPLRGPVAPPSADHRIFLPKMFFVAKNLSYAQAREFRELMQEVYGG
jgi:hypothetical protein